jgi:hypothetical protein
MLAKVELRYFSIKNNVEVISKSPRHFYFLKFYANNLNKPLTSQLQTNIQTSKNKTTVETTLIGLEKETTTIGSISS